MSATTLPLVAAMLLVAAIEIVDDDYRYPHFDLVILLLTIIFDISYRKSALKLAEDRGHSAIVNALLAAGAH